MSQNDWICKDLARKGYNVKRRTRYFLNEAKARGLYEHLRVQEYYEDLVRDAM